MRRLGLIVGMLLLTSVGALAAESASMKDFLAGKVAPFTLKLKDLDGSYLRFSSSYISSGGWLSLMPRYGGEGVPTYTQGRTINIGGEDFLLAYGVEVKGGDSSMFMYGRPDPNATEPEPVTGDSILSLMLIGQRGITALVKVRPFNLATELADFQRYLDSYQQMAASRNAMNQPGGMQAPPDNLKLVAIALDMFASDHDGVFPPMDKPEAFRKALDEYVENAEIFKDPDTKEYYAINPTLSGKKLKEIKNPAEIIAVYQSKPGKDGKRGVAFVDGSIKRLTGAEWTDLKVKSNIP
jgi:hypothetical protein